MDIQDPVLLMLPRIFCCCLYIRREEGDEEEKLIAQNGVEWISDFCSTEQQLCYVCNVWYNAMQRQFSSLSRRVVLTCEQTTSFSQDAASVPGLASSPETWVFYVCFNAQCGCAQSVFDLQRTEMYWFPLKLVVDVVCCVHSVTVLSQSQLLEIHISVGNSSFTPVSSEIGK